MFQLIFAVLTGGVITIAFVKELRSKGTWDNAWLLYFVILIMMVAGLVWITSAGPVWRDVAWVPVLILGLIVALLLAAVSPGNDHVSVGFYCIDVYGHLK